ncbi:MAG: DUF4197 domain-containing protein [Bacteroidales bacterium]|nr:DUF4197 domain-containing protein [Bacteroidales bacterium]
MKRQLIFLFLLSFLSFSSCDVVEDIAKVIEEESPLTEQEVIKGLKEALRVSTDTAVNIVSAVNGYYGDNLIKILLPPEADIIVKNMNHPLLKAIGITDMIEDVVMRMNRAAENAAKQATPIFVNSIKSMTIKDAFDILNGSDTAATHYFRKKTYHQLQNTFKPKIRNSLNKPIVGGVSANKAWTTLTNGYNEVANIVPGWKKVNTQLDEYVTGKALNGLFIKVAYEEKQIRNDPLARVTDILKRVFGNKGYF